MTRKHKALAGRHPNKPVPERPVDPPCTTCRTMWATFEATGDTGERLGHAACLRALVGPRTTPAVGTMVKRMPPQPLLPTAKGWWER